MECEDLDGDTQIYCDICKKMVTISSMCQHFQVQETEESPEDLEKCTEETNVNSGSMEEPLISTIEAYPILWDSTIEIKYKSKTAKDNVWLEIFNLFDGKFSIELLKKKWKNLKDTYIKSKNDLETYTPSGSGAIKKQKPWKFYKAMKFLSDQQPQRLTASNLMSPPLPPPTTSDESQSTSYKKVKRKCDPVETALLDTIKQVAPPPQLPTEKINPICVRISEMREELSGREKAEAEIKLMQTVFDIKYKSY